MPWDLEELVEDQVNGAGGGARGAGTSGVSSPIEGGAIGGNGGVGSSCSRLSACSGTEGTVGKSSEGAGGGARGAGISGISSPMEGGAIVGSSGNDCSFSILSAGSGIEVAGGKSRDGGAGGQVLPRYLPQLMEVQWEAILKWNFPDLYRQQPLWGI